MRSSPTSNLAGPVRSSEPLSQLGRQLQIHQTSITSLVDKLEDRGLIKRTPRGRTITKLGRVHIGAPAIAEPKLF